MPKVVLGWERLLILRNSLISRVLTVFSVSVIVLSSLVPVSDFLEMTWRYLMIYFGSVLFFSGYIYSQLRAPLEFKETPYISEIIQRMKARNATAVFKSRIDMTESLVKRIEQQPPPDLPEGVLDHARYVAQRARAQAEAGTWRDEQGELYYCDLNLRQYDCLRSRQISTGLMALGFAMILSPTAVSALSIPVNLLKALAAGG